MAKVATGLNKKIMQKLREIRALLDKNGGCQYLSMCVYADGDLRFNNAHWDGEKCKGLRLEGYEHRKNN